MGPAKLRGTRDERVVQSKQQLLKQLRALDDQLGKADAPQFEELLPTWHKPLKRYEHAQ